MSAVEVIAGGPKRPMALQQALGGLTMFAARPAGLVTNTAGALLIPVPISPPKMDGIEQFVRWRGSAGSCHASSGRLCPRPAAALL